MSMAAHEHSNALQEQPSLNLNLRNHTNSDPSTFVETLAGQSRNPPNEEDLLQSDEQASPNEDDQPEEEEFDEFEPGSEIGEPSEAGESDKTDGNELYFTAEDIDHDLGGVAIVGDYQGLNRLDEDEDMEIRMLIAFSGTSPLYIYADNKIFKSWRAGNLPFVCSNGIVNSPVSQKQHTMTYNAVSCHPSA
jgi:hypothetical protein